MFDFYISTTSDPPPSPISISIIKSKFKQAGAELGQAHIKLELGFTLIILLN